MEQTKTSANTVFIDTRNARVEISSQSYNGAVPNVGLYSSSNVVVSNTPGDNVVIYATGSIVVGGSIVGNSANAMLTTSTDTVSGAKTFVGSVTFSSATYGMWVEVASATLSAASSYTFSNLIATTTYRMEWNISQNTTSGATEFRFNGDTGSNYQWTIRGNNSAGSDHQTANNADSKCMAFGVSVMSIGNDAMGVFTFRTAAASSVRVYGFGEVVADDGNPFEFNQINGCRYAGAATLNSITLLDSGGSMTGVAKLYQRWDR